MENSVQENIFNLTAGKITMPPLGFHRPSGEWSRGSECQSSRVTSILLVLSRYLSAPPDIRPSKEQGISLVSTTVTGTAGLLDVSGPSGRSYILAHF